MQCIDNYDITNTTIEDCAHTVCTFDNNSNIFGLNELSGHCPDNCADAVCTIEQYHKFFITRLISASLGSLVLYLDTNIFSASPSKA